MKMRLPMAVAILFGSATLIAYFLPFSPLDEVKKLMLEWASLVSAVALLLGILNLLLVHIEKFASFKAGWMYSIVLLLAFIFVVGLGLLAPALEATQKADAAFKPAEVMRLLSRLLYVYVQTPLESSLLAVLAVVLVMAGARVVYQRRQWSAAFFVLVSLILLIGVVPFVPLLGDVREWIVQVPALAGARGILIGITLGAITTGMRVIMGVDRPYGE